MIAWRTKLILTLATLATAIAPAAFRAVGPAAAADLGPAPDDGQIRIAEAADRLTAKLHLAPAQRALFVEMKSAVRQLRLDRRRGDAIALAADRDVMKDAAGGFFASLSDVQRRELTAWRAERRAKAEQRLQAMADGTTTKLHLTTAQRALFDAVRTAAREARFTPFTDLDRLAAAHEAKIAAWDKFVGSLNDAQRQEMTATMDAEFREHAPATTTE
jgi:hypothetical protein